MAFWNAKWIIFASSINVSNRFSDKSLCCSKYEWTPMSVCSREAKTLKRYTLLFLYLHLPKLGITINKITNHYEKSTEFLLFSSYSPWNSDDENLMIGNLKEKYYGPILGISWHHLALQLFHLRSMFLCLCIKICVHKAPYVLVV